MKKTTGSNVQNSSRLASSSFRYTEYERPGVSHDEIKEIKEVFDLFDSHRNGVVRPRGTSSLTQTFKTRSMLSALKPMAPPFST
jgi:Ca2+-binding EF-hand superfamily protein